MTREEVKDLLKFIIRKRDLIINNDNYTADEYAQDKVEDIAEMCHRALDGQFGEIAPNDVTNAPFAIVTNTKTGKWFRAKKCRETMTRHKDLSVDITFSITPENINDAVPVIGTYRLAVDGMTKKEFIGDNVEIRVEIYDKDKIKQDEFFLYNAWISGIDSETNEIVLKCDWVK